MAFAASDEVLGSVIPVAVYWIYAGIFDVLRDKLDKYKLHSKAEEDTQDNIVPKSTVIKSVLLQQAFQIFISMLLLALNKDRSNIQKPNPPLYIIAVQFLVGIFMLDTWLYFMHRCYHVNKFLYKHIHYVHHKLVVPYSYGAIYTHPVEGLIDHIGASLALLVTGMTPRVGVFFFSLVNIKAIDVHTGIWWPYNILNLYSNSSAYHDVHHQLYGAKVNFEIFFSFWDRITGTCMPFSLEERKEGGYMVQPVKPKCKSFVGGDTQTYQKKSE